MLSSIFVNKNFIMENRLIKNTLDNKESPSSISSTVEVDNDLSFSLPEKKELQKQTEEELTILRIQTKITTFESVFNKQDANENFIDFEKMSKKSTDDITPWDRNVNKSKTNPDYKNWDLHSEAGLAKTYNDLQKLGFDVESDFYKSVFAILLNAHNLISSGHFDQNPGNVVVQNPFLYKAQIENLVDPSVNYDGKLYMACLNHIIEIQQSLLKNDLSTFRHEEPSWGEKKGEKISGYVNDFVSGVQSAFKEKNIPKILMYGLGGFFAFKAGSHIWEKPIGRGAVVLGGIASLFYLSGNGKALENAFGRVADNGKKAAGITLGAGASTIDYLMGIIGADPELITLVEALGLNKEKLTDILGDSLNSFDNLESVLSNSADPNSFEVKKMGINTNILYNIKDVNLKELNDLVKLSDQKDPMAKFIPPNSAILKKYFPEFATTTSLPVFRTAKELNDIKENSSIVKSGGFNNNYANYVETGKMLYNIVSAMRITYNENIKSNENKYFKMTFDQVISTDKLKDGTVLNYLDTLREYSAKDNEKFLAQLKLMIDNLPTNHPSYTESLDFKIESFDKVNNIFTVRVFGMPMRAVFDHSTKNYELYLAKDVAKNEAITPNHAGLMFLSIPSELKNGVFLNKFSNVFNDNAESLKASIPSGEIELNGKKYSKEDMIFGTFTRDAGKWIVPIISKSERDKGNEVILHVGIVHFGEDCNPVIEYKSRNEFAHIKDRFNQISSNNNNINNSNFEHINNYFNQINVHKPNFTDNIDFEPLSFDSDNNVYTVKINGVKFKAFYNSTSLNYEIYLTSIVPDNTAINNQSVFFSIPNDLENGFLKNLYFETFFKNNLRMTDTEFVIDGVVIGKDNKSYIKDELYYDKNRKAWILPIKENATGSSNIVENAIITQLENGSFQVRYENLMTVNLPEVKNTPTKSVTENPIYSIEKLKKDGFLKVINNDFEGQGFGKVSIVNAELFGFIVKFKLIGGKLELHSTNRRLLTFDSTTKLSDLSAVFENQVKSLILRDARKLNVNGVDYEPSDFEISNLTVKAPNKWEYRILSKSELANGRHLILKNNGEIEIKNVLSSIPLR